ncbi:hypothetical protein QCA50_000756 [Cerrena zonata]|uniref:Peptidase A1 domain-containing protein n=1 Tax=Cerrena zonata TaxID=2478898 RepID=A0AAW0GRT8_9APHY
MRLAQCVPFPVPFSFLRTPTMGKSVSLLFLLCLLLVGQGVFAISMPWSKMEKRDDAPFIPVRRDIQLKFDSVGRYVATVSMANDTQHFQFTMSSQSGLTYVAGAQCSACSGVNLYNQSASTTAKNCSLTMTNGSQWSYPNQTIVVTNNVTTKFQDNSAAIIGQGLNGLIGIGTNRHLAPRSSNNSAYSGNFEDSIMGQWLMANPQADNFTFGMALNSPIVQATLRGESPPSSGSTDGGSSDSAAGVVHMLQPDHSVYTADSLAWATVNNSLNPQDDPQDWTVPLDGWTLVTGSNQVSSRKSMVANIDPLYQGMYIPLDQATLIHNAIEGSVQLPAVSTLGSLAQTWKVPCDSKITLGITVGTQTFTLDSSTLVIKMGDGTCISGIEAWTSSDLNSYLFGARFISVFYLIFSVPRDGPAAIGFANRVETGSHKKPVGAIVGGTIGGVALLVFSGIAIWFFFIRRRYSRPYVYGIQEEEKTNHNVQPYPLFPPQSEPSVSPTQSSYYPSMHYTASSIPGSEPSPSQILFTGSQISTPAQTPHAAMLIAQNAGPEDVPPAYQPENEPEQPRDVKNSNLYQSDASGAGGSSSA